MTQLSREAIEIIEGMAANKRRADAERQAQHDAQAHAEKMQKADAIEHTMADKLRREFVPLWNEFASILQAPAQDVARLVEIAPLLFALNNEALIEADKSARSRQIGDYVMRNRNRMFELAGLPMPDDGNIDVMPPGLSDAVRVLGRLVLRGYITAQGGARGIQL